MAAVRVRGAKCAISEILLWLAAKKSAKGDPVPIFLPCFYNNEVGTEAPEARAGPRSPDVFYRGEEAGAVLKSLQAK